MFTGSSVAATRDATTVGVHVRARVPRVLSFGSYEVEESARGPVERFVPPGAVHSAIPHRRHCVRPAAHG
jgi:hypothetical protein